MRPTLPSQNILSPYTVADSFHQQGYSFFETIKSISEPVDCHVIIDSSIEKKIKGLWSLALENFLLGLYRYKKHTHVKSVTVVCSSIALCRELLQKKASILIRVEATGRAREYVNLPSNLATPLFFKHEAQKLRRTPGMHVNILGKKELRQEKLSLLESVGHSSLNEPYLVHISYRPTKKTTRPLAIIGKGVTFDTGGLALKTQEGMYGMKSDMAGAGVVLACAFAVAKLQPNRPIDFLMPFVENHLGHGANKPGDVIVSRSGKSVEVVNPDAEGRLILADTFDYALSHVKPALIIDIATLTAACMFGLGDEIGALFSNSDDLQHKFLNISQHSGERFWPLPLEKSYAHLNKSDFADLKNYPGKNAGSIAAALFLQEFIGECPWLHLDVLGPSFAFETRDSGIKGATGFGVRTLLNWIQS